ncbi:MAG: hypothetical protein K8S24_10595 [Candidatus Aegiribacteria sp.]|nr:hypothetical protein [Candidatus Aegiribacteria sp.]
MLIILFLIYPVMADIPDNVFDSGIYEVMEHIGDDCLIDVTFSEADSVTSCFGYSVSADSTDFWVLTVDYSGIPIDRQELCIRQDNPENWIRGIFLKPGLLLIIKGEYTPGSFPEFHSIDLSNLDNSRHSAIPVEINTDEILILMSLKKCPDGRLLAAGTRCSPEDGHTLFVMKLEYEGTILWETPLVENYEEQFSQASLEVMSDGGCILSYDQDCFPLSSIPICRLGSDGQILWHRSLQVDNELIAGLSGFIELDNESILCTGTVECMRQMAFRGFTVCLDSLGEEIWRRIDWYRDHTLFRSARITPQGDFLITACTGEEGDYPLEAVNTDVLLVIMENDGSRIIGTELSAEGDQKVHAVFLTESGQIIVTGTEVQPGKDEADVFFWKLDFEEIRPQ